MARPDFNSSGTLGCSRPSHKIRKNVVGAPLSDITGAEIADHMQQPRAYYQRDGFHQ